ncbi:MAG: alpha/beta fold hydrolase [Dehalococcoidia bacterium]|nr:alpha/beta fold hydrolase [Dehalococcoidia bacterium]
MERPVQFASDGLRVRGDMHIVGPAAPWVVMSHGLESSKDGDKWPVLAGALVQVGISALRFNHRGCGQGPQASEGAFQDTTLTGRIADFRAALDMAASTAGDGPDRIGAVGSSFGGMVVAAARDPRVRVLALLATPVAIPAPAAQEIVDGYHYLQSGSRLCAGFFRDVARYDILAAVRDFRGPVLVVHGDRDDVVPVEHAVRLHDAARGPKRLEVIPGADHVFSAPEHRERAVALCVEWFKTHLA